MDNRIAELRKEKGMTLKQLARELNIRDNTLSQYETDKRSPQLGLLQEIANYFNVSIEYITKYSDKRDYPIDNDEDALFLIEKLKNEKDFNYMNLSNATSLKLCMWIIENEDLINFKYQQYINTAQFFLKNVISENKIINHYSEHRVEKQKTVDEIDNLLLEEEYYGADAKEVYKFMKESERIGLKKTKELLSYMETLPDLSDDEELF